MSAIAHLDAAVASAWRFIRPKRPTLSREDWLRLGSGIILAAIVGGIIGRDAPAGQAFVNVGSFFGAMVCLLPRHHSRPASVLAGMLLINGGAVLGVVLRERPVVALFVLFVGLFIAGFVRAISVGGFMRIMFGSIAVCAAGELSQAASETSQIWGGLGAFALGQLIVAACALIGHRPQAFVLQREAAAELYRQLIALGRSERSNYVPARSLARESVEVTPLLALSRFRWIRRLVELSSEIASVHPGSIRSGDLEALSWIVEILEARNPPPLPEGLELSPAVSLAVASAGTGRRSAAGVRLRNLSPSSTLRLYWRELQDLRGSSLRFALRVAITGVLCQALGLYVVKDFGLPYHGFWILLAGCLIAMPDFDGTSGKAIARTAGSVVGAVLGTALSLVPLLQTRTGHLVAVTIFVLAYLAARTMSQGLMMVVVVGWLALLLGGEPAAFTRAIDTIVGAFVAAVVFYALPTWNVNRLGRLFTQWCTLGKAALLAAATEPVGVSDEERQPRRTAMINFVHAQFRFAFAADAVPAEPRSDRSPWPVKELAAISATMDRTVLAVIQVRGWAAGDGQDAASTAQPPLPSRMAQLGPYAEWFAALASGRGALLPPPAEQPLHSLWEELSALQELVLDHAESDMTRP